MIHRAICLLAAAALILAGCGDKTPSGPAGQGGPFSAKIDGVAWASPALYSAAAMGNNAVFSIIGTDGAVGNATGVSLVLYYIDQPGSYPLGVGGSVRGGTAIITSGSSSWATPLSGNAGTVDVTSVSSTRIAGTFSFNATPQSGAAQGTRAVTQGVFDVPVQSSSGTFSVPAHLGSKFGGTLGGQPWNAATVVMVGAPASGTVVIGASNTQHSITMILSGFAGAGSYALNTGVARSMTVTLSGTSSQWGGAGALSSGTVNITSVTASRIAGTYTATLPPSVSASGTMSLSGTFEVGIPQ
jgi:hypothetical protein